MSNTQRGAENCSPYEKRSTETENSADVEDVHPTDLTQFQTNILAILAKDPQYGLGIKRDLEAYYGQEVNHGRLYPNLDDLVEQGLVEKSELDKRTNQYELTEKARALLGVRLEWLLHNLSTEEYSEGEIAEAVLRLIGGEV